MSAEGMSEPRELVPGGRYRIICGANVALVVNATDPNRGVAQIQITDAVIRVQSVSPAGGMIFECGAYPGMTWSVAPDLLQRGEASGALSITEEL